MRGQQIEARTKEYGPLTAVSDFGSLRMAAV